MKNMKISAKLITSFLIVVLLAVIVGGVGIIGMSQISTADREMYDDNYLPTVMAADIAQIVVEQRVYIRNFVIYDVNADADIFSSAESGLEDARTRMDTLLANYSGTISETDDQNAYDAFKTTYHGDWANIVNSIHDLGLANMTGEAKTALTQASQIASQLDALASTLQQVNLESGQKTVDSNTALFTTMTIIEIVVLVVAVVVSMIIATYISSLISKPTRFMKDILMRIGTKGDLDFAEAEYRQIESYAAAKDEVGESVNMLLTTVRRLVKVGAALTTVSNGDLTAELTPISDRDTMGNSLQQMINNLNDMFGEINNSTSQVNTGSKQIADGAQALAQGSTEQAAAVEQLSSSISEVAEKTKENADMAGKAATLASTIKTNAEKGTRQMDEMTAAVKDINDASQSISKVIKVIDDIAFQTNILALNAAVEAARAGQHGKGFAVVAEEVRSLAAKSAEAAKDTSSMIANSIEKAELGARIADETSASLTDIVAGINESNQIVGEIARSSGEQSIAIAQINKGIDQVAQVVQQNSATAEESAAASEEMSSQSQMLETLVAQFKLKNSSSGYQSTITPPRSRQLDMPSKTTYVPTESGFGKY